MVRSWLVWPTAACLATCIFAEQPPTPGHTGQPHLLIQAQRSAINETGRSIELNVQVTTAAGRPVSGIKASDFALFDNGKQTEIDGFKEISDASAPVHAVLVFDEVNNPTNQLKEIKKQLVEYLNADQEPLPFPTSIAFFTGVDFKTDEYTRDPQELLSTVADNTHELKAAGCIDAHGEEETRTSTIPSDVLDCRNERFLNSTNALREFAKNLGKLRGRVLLLWLGPGWPLLTDPSFRSDSSSLKVSFFHQIVSLSQTLIHSRVTVDALLSPDNSPKPSDPHTHAKAFFQGAKSASEASAGYLGLHVLAHQTGGRIFTNTRNLKSEIVQCLQDGSDYYRLVFESPGGKAFGEFHTIDVKVSWPGLKVRTNSFYYAIY